MKIVITTDLERTKMMLGETLHDEKIFLKTGALLKVVTDESVVASKLNMTIAVKNCASFKNVKVGSYIFFDMGSIVAEIQT